MELAGFEPAFCKDGSFLQSAFYSLGHYALVLQSITKSAPAVTKCGKYR